MTGLMTSVLAADAPYQIGDQKSGYMFLPPDLQAMQIMGCDFGQGHLIAPPMPKDDFMALLQQRMNKPRPKPAEPADTEARTFADIENGEPDGALDEMALDAAIL